MGGREDNAPPCTEAGRRWDARMRLDRHRQWERQCHPVHSWSRCGGASPQLRGDEVTGDSEQLRTGNHTRHLWVGWGGGTSRRLLWSSRQGEGEGLDPERFVTTWVEHEGQRKEGKAPFRQAGEA